MRSRIEIVSYVVGALGIFMIAYGVLRGGDQHPAPPESTLNELSCKSVGAETLALIERSDFQELDRTLDRSISSQERMATGGLSIHCRIGAAVKCAGCSEGVDGISQDLLKIEEWIAATGSAHARIAKIEALTTRASMFRGSDIYARVRPEGLSLMQADLDTARQIFADDSSLSAHPAGFRQRIRMSNVDGREKREVLLAIAEKQFPTDASIMGDLMVRYLPGWGGSFEELGEFLNQRVDSIQDANEKRWMFIGLGRVWASSPGVVDIDRLRDEYLVVLNENPSMVSLHYAVNYFCWIEDYKGIVAMRDKFGEAKVMESIKDDAALKFCGDFRTAQIMQRGVPVQSEEPIMGLIENPYKVASETPNYTAIGDVYKISGGNWACQAVENAVVPLMKQLIDVSGKSSTDRSEDYSGFFDGEKFCELVNSCISRTLYIPEGMLDLNGLKSFYESDLGLNFMAALERELTQSSYQLPSHPALEQIAVGHMYLGTMTYPFQEFAKRLGSDSAVAFENFYYQNSGNTDPDAQILFNNFSLFRGKHLHGFSVADVEKINAALSTTTAREFSNRARVCTQSISWSILRDVSKNLSE